MHFVIHTSEFLAKFLKNAENHYINEWTVLNINKKIDIPHDKIVELGYVRCESYEKDELKHFALYVCKKFAHTVPDIKGYRSMMKIALIIKLANGQVFYTRSDKFPDTYYPITRAVSSGVSHASQIRLLLQAHGIDNFIRHRCISKIKTRVKHPFNEAFIMPVFWYTYCVTVDNCYSDRYELISAADVCRLKFSRLEIDDLEKKIINA